MRVANKGILLGVELDDKLFVEVKVDIVSCGEGYDLSRKIGLINVEPLGSGLALKSLSQMKQDRRDRKALAERRAQRQARVERRREDAKMTKRRRG